MKLRATLLSTDARGERRGAERRVISLMVSTLADGDTVEATISDLSNSGLRLATKARLDIGSIVEVELLEDQLFEAEVLWARDAEYGCQFVEPIPTGIVWNALLQATFEIDEAATTFVIDEIKIGNIEDHEKIALWKAEFAERANGSEEELIGFRKVGEFDLRPDRPPQAKLIPRKPALAHMLEAVPRTRAAANPNGTKPNGASFALFGKRPATED